MTAGKRINIKAVLVGVLVDLGGSIASGLIGGIAQSIVLAAKGVPAEEMADHEMHVAAAALTVAIGLGGTVVAGYVAGRIAKKAEVVHGGIVGAIPIPFSLVGAVFWPIFPQWPLWVAIAGLVGTIPSGMTGGFLARHRRESRLEPSRSPSARP